ncbi:MAG TPA: hypothetical protein VD704_05335 [Gaiellaceae bacterium]|nr:hypothetical protein [Gaiellaceae bacterium]
MGPGDLVCLKRSVEGVTPGQVGVVVALQPGEKALVKLSSATEVLVPLDALRSVCAPDSPESG